jgi:hypothetical protein
MAVNIPQDSGSLMQLRVHSCETHQQLCTAFVLVDGAGRGILEEPPVPLPDGLCQGPHHALDLVPSTDLIDPTTATATDMVKHIVKLV